MGLFPGSSDKYAGDATTYGPLPDHGFGADEVCIVLHTTETTGVPSFNDGDTAPHYLYDPRDRSFYVWAEYEDGRVGTLKGHNTNHGNCIAFQLEILAYSDKAVAQSVDGLWVGDFQAHHYDDLAEWVAWARDRYGFADTVTPTPAGGWLYGTSSPHRMDWDTYQAFGGLTAHGAVPGNTHWDTGVLDLELIADLTPAPPGPTTCPWPDAPCVDDGKRSHWTPASDLPYGSGTDQAQGQCRVPYAQRDAITWAFGTGGLFRAGNRHRYDYDVALTEGRYAVFEWRDAGSP